MAPGVIILMGVSGCGKTTVGKLLADRLGWDFLDGDDYHPPGNVAKMSRGLPLDDDDRGGWLADLAARIRAHLAAQRPMVLACSALKEVYREALRVDPQAVRFVYLKGTPSQIRERMQARRGHYMQAGMLASQFAILEEPADALSLDIAKSPSELVNEILRTWFKELTVSSG